MTDAANLPGPDAISPSQLAQSIRTLDRGIRQLTVLRDDMRIAAQQIDSSIQTARIALQAASETALVVFATTDREHAPEMKALALSILGELAKEDSGSLMMYEIRARLSSKVLLRDLHSAFTDLSKLALVSSDGTKIAITDAGIALIVAHASDTPLSA